MRDLGPRRNRSSHPRKFLHDCLICLTAFALLSPASGWAQSADLDVSIGTWPTSYTPGATATNAYQFTVENLGTDNTTGATVTAIFDDPAALASMTWTCSADSGSSCGSASGSGTSINTTVDLENGDTATFTLSPVFDGDATADPLMLTATAAVTGGDTDPVGSNNSASRTSSRSPDLDIRVVSLTDGASIYYPGSSATYTFTVDSNGGPTHVDNVGVSLSIPAGASLVSWTCTDGAGSNCDTASGTTTFTGVTVDLDDGASVSFSLNVNYSISATGPLALTATASTPAGDSNTGNNSDTDSNNPAQAEVSVTIDDGGPSYTPGASSTYTITISNAGPDPTSGVQVFNALPVEVTSASWTCSADPGSSCADASGTGSIDTTVDLQNGDAATLTVVANFDSGALANPLENSASININDGALNGTSDDSDTDSNALDRVVGLSITKSTVALPLVPGQALTYDILVSNAGPSDLGAGPGEAGILLADDLDSDFVGHPANCTNPSLPCYIYCSTESAIGDGNISPTNCGAELSEETGDITDLSVRLTAGSSSLIQVQVQLVGSASGAECDASNAGSDEICNTAVMVLQDTATTRDTSGSVVFDDSVVNNIQVGTDLLLTKTDDDSAVPGLAHEYTVVVRNNGALDVSGVTVTDILPIGPTAGFVSGSVSWTCSADPGACCLSGGQCGVSQPVGPFTFDQLDALVDLDAATEVTFTITGTLDPRFSGMLTNTASGLLPPGIDELDPGNDSATDVTTVVPVVDLEISKTLESLLVNETDNSVFDLQYRIVVNNLGPSFADGAAVADPFNDIGFDPATISWVCSISGNQGSSACNEGDPGPVVGAIATTVDLDPGASAIFLASVSTRPATTGIVSNTATAAIPGDLASVTLDTSLSATADLVLTKDDSRTTATPGEELVYTLTVNNFGPDDVFGATVTDIFPPELTDVSWTCDATTPIPGELNFFANSDQGAPGNAMVQSADSRHYYVASGDSQSVLVFSRNNVPGTGFGDLVFLEQEEQGVDDASDPGATVDGLGQPLSLALSGDGNHLYVLTSGGEDTSVALFTRSTNALAPDFGELSFVAAIRDVMPDDDLPDVARDLVVSPDGEHVYVSGDGRVAVFDRDGGTGVLTVNSDQAMAVPVNAGPLAISPNGEQLYVADVIAADVSAFQRNIDSADAAFGQLTPINAATDADLAAVLDLVISGDGKHLYAAGSGTGNLALLAIDGGDGSISLSDTYDDAVISVSNGGTLAGVNAVAISRDGEHVFSGTAAADAILVFRRTAINGALNHEQEVVEGFPLPPDPTVSGIDGISALLVSSDGRHVLATAAGGSGRSLTELERRAPDPLFAFIEQEVQGIDGVDGLQGAAAVAVAPDGGHVYSAAIGSDAVNVFDRDPEKGATAASRGQHLTYRASYDDSVDASDGDAGLLEVDSIIVSPNNRWVYAASGDNGSLTAFARDDLNASVTFGELTFVEDYADGVDGVDGLLGASALAIDSGAAHLYVAAEFEAAVGVFSINDTDGRLTFLQKVANGDPGVEGLAGASDLVVTPMGAHVIVASNEDDAVVVLERNTNLAELDFGQLRFLQRVDGVGDRPMGVDISADGRHVYVTSANDHRLTVLQRNTNSASVDFGRLSVVTSYADGADGLDNFRGVRTVQVSSDQKRVYVGAELDHALSVFDRDTDELSASFGRLTLVEQRVDSVDGVNGLRQIYQLAVSRDSRHVYAAGFADNAVASFLRGVGSNCTAGGSGNVVDTVDIGAGGTLTYTVTTRVRPDATGTLMNSATVAGPASFTEASPGDETDMDTTTLVPEAALSVSKTSDVVAVVPGEPITYTVRVSNDGPSNAVSGGGDVTLTDILSTNPGFEPGSVSWTCEAQGSGALSFVEAQIDGSDGVEGLDGVSGVAFSVDLAGLGPHLVTSSVLDNAVTAFSLNPADGSLTQVDVYPDDGSSLLAGASDVAVSDSYVYVTSQVDDAVNVFQAVAVTPMGGLPQVELQFLQSVTNGSGVSGLNQAVAVTVSPAGDNLYVAGANDNALVVFDIAPNGLLAHSQTLIDGLGGVTGLSGINDVQVSPDGDHVYASASDAGTVSLFDRAPGGTLSYVVSYDSLSSGLLMDGAASLALSPDGEQVYLVGALSNTLVSFHRDADSGSGLYGELTPLQQLAETDVGVAGLVGPRDVLLSPDGRHVYVAAENGDSVAWFVRDNSDISPEFGTLSFGNLVVDGVAGFEGLNGAGSLAIDSEGDFLFAAGVMEDGLAVLQRSADSSCPSNGTGDLVDVNIDVAAGGEVTFMITATVAGDASGILNNTATLTANMDTTASDNTDTQGVNLNPTADLAVTKSDGLAQFDGLLGAVALAGDDRHLYVAGQQDNGIAILARDANLMSPDFGTLTFLDSLNNGEDGISGITQVSDLLLTASGEQLYAAGRGDSSIVVFQRDLVSGELTILESQQQGVSGVNGISGVSALALSTDQAHLYASGPFDNSVAVFERDLVTGALTFLARVQDGVDTATGDMDGPSAIAVSPDDLHVYVSAADSGSVALFQRNPNSGSASFGQLTFVAAYRNDDPGIGGLAGASSLTVSADGAYVYVLGPQDQALALFSRDAVSGELQFVEFYQNGSGSVAGLELASRLRLSGDGEHLYVAGAGENALVRFDREPATGMLSAGQLVRDGDPLGPPGQFVDGLAGASDVVVTPDGQNIYVSAQVDHAVAAFARDSVSTSAGFGDAAFLQALIDGLGGAAPGSDIIYLITVSNLGPSDVTGARVVDAFPAEFSSVSYTCSPEGGASCITTPSTGSIDELVNIPVGGRVIYRATASIRSDMVGVLSNTATVTLPSGISDPNAENNSATDDDTVLSRATDLLVTKTNGVSQVVPGTPVSYVVTVTNPGPSDAPATLVTDLVPESVSNVTWACVATPEPGLLSFVGPATGSLDSYRGLTVSTDGRHAYAVGEASGVAAVAALERDERTGELVETAIYRNGQDGFTGLSGAVGVTLSMDGRHLYVASEIDDSVAVLSRDLSSGELSFVEVEIDTINSVNGLGGARFARVSPDDRHVYVGGTQDDAIGVFSRDAGTGALSWISTVNQGQDGNDGLNGVYDMVFDADGSHAYVVGDANDAVAVYSRDASTGALTFQSAVQDFQTLVNALQQPRAVALADDRQLFVASFGSDALAIFDVDSDTGDLTFDTAVFQGSGGITRMAGPEGLVLGLEGSELYVAGSVSNAVTLFRLGDGLPEPIASYDSGAIGELAGVNRLSRSADGRHVYSFGDAAAASATFERNGGSRCTGSGTGQLSDMADIAAGGQVSYTISGQVLAGARGQLINTATAVAGPLVTELDAGSNTAVDSDPLVPTSDLSIAKSDGLTQVEAGTSLTYDLALSAAGPSHVDVTVTDPLPIFPTATAGFLTGSVAWTCDTAEALQFFAEYGDTGSNGLAGASDILVSQDGLFVYVTSAMENSVSVFARAGNGSLTFVARVVEGDELSGGTVSGIEGASGMALDGEGTFLYVTGETDDSVVVFSRDAGTGLLDYVETQTSGVTPVFGLQQPLAVTVTPDNQFLYVAASGGSGGAITVFQRDPASGQLTWVERVRDGLGTIVPESNVINGVVDLSVSVDGRFLYAAARVSHALSVFERDPTSGVLTFVQVVRSGDVLPGGTVEGLAGIQRIVLSPNGDFLYGVGSDDDSLVRFIRAPGDGRLDFDERLTASPDLPLDSPSALALNSDGSRLAVVAAGSNALLLFDRSSSTGTTELADVLINGDEGSSRLQSPLAVTFSADDADALVLTTSGLVAAHVTTPADCAAIGGTGDVVSVDIEAPAGSGAAMTVSALVHPSARGIINNVAAVSFPPGSADPVLANNASPDQTLIVANTDVSLTKSGSAEVTAGEAISYTLTLRNAGPSDALGVELIDTFTPNVTDISWTCAAAGRSTCPAVSGTGDLDVFFDVAIDGEVVFEVSGTVADFVGGTLTNTATAVVEEAAVNTDRNLGNNTASADTDVITLVDLALAKQDLVDPYDPDSAFPLTYRVSISNAGPHYAQDVVVSDTLPSGMVFADSTQCTAGAGPSEVVCDVGVLPPGTIDVEYSVWVQIPAPDLITNLAAVTTSSVDTSDGNNVASEDTSLQSGADIEVTKYDDAHVVMRGDMLSYTVQVRNIGSVDVPVADLTDALPMELVNVTWVCDASGGGVCPNASGTGDLAESLSLPAGAVLTYTVSAQVDPGLDENTAYTLTNVASVAEAAGGETNTANNTGIDINLVPNWIFRDGFEDPLKSSYWGFKLMPDGRLSEPVTAGSCRELRLHHFDLELADGLAQVLMTWADPTTGLVARLELGRWHGRDWVRRVDRTGASGWSTWAVGKPSVVTLANGRLDFVSGDGKLRALPLRPLGPEQMVELWPLRVRSAAVIDVGIRECEGGPALE